MAKWDIYAKANPIDFSILHQDMPGDIPLFKSDNIEDYKRFRSVIQVIDLSILDINIYKYDKKAIIAAALYFQIGLFYNVFKRDEISMIPDISTLLINLEQ